MLTPDLLEPKYQSENALKTKQITTCRPKIRYGGGNFVGTLWQLIKRNSLELLIPYLLIFVN
jgi:hypothetical protein